MGIAPAVEKAESSEAAAAASGPSCPCCGGHNCEVIYKVASIPVHSCVLLDTAEAAHAFPKRDLELAFCGDCGFAFNHVFDERVIRYSTDFEESQHFSSTFNSFARGLARQIAERCGVSGKQVLEIGCGKGEFLIELCEAAGASGVGIDPGYRADPGRRPTKANVSFIVDRFGPEYQDLECDVVLCRHTLEHLPHVAEFMRSIRDMRGTGPDTWIVFETPDFKRVLEDGAFWDIYYEHCSYFSPGAHARVFRAHGFDVTDLELVYDAQYIVQYARPSAGPAAETLPLERDLDELRRLAEAFPSRVRALQARWRELLGEAHAQGWRTVLWGGGSKAVSFLTTLGLGDEIAAAVDINPYKQGRFTPGTGHPVIAPEALKANPPDLVIVMNPVYREEVKAALAGLRLHPGVVAV